jgi:hypothetical protein
LAYINNTNDKNRDALLFNLSAFLSAIRSITADYMQKQYGEKHGFSEWYKQQNLGSDPEIVFLNKVRVDFIHLNPRIITTERGASISATGLVVYSDNDPRKKTAPPLPETLPPEPTPIQITTYDVIFRVDDEMIKIGLKNDLSVLDFCHRQYEKLEDLVNRCEERFK